MSVEVHDEFLTMAQLRMKIRETINPRCDHPATVFMYVPCSNGTKQIRRICTKCQWKIGGAVSKSEVSGTIQDWTPPPSDDAMKAAVEAEVQKVWWENYNQYLTSDRWLGIRTFWLRIQPICCMCGEAKSTHAHHVRYDNVGKECLGDIVGLCAPCHQRLHPHRDLCSRIPRS